MGVPDTESRPISDVAAMSEICNSAEDSCVKSQCSLTYNKGIRRGPLSESHSIGSVTTESAIPNCGEK